MLRKDSLLLQIQQLTQVLAKIMGLKKQGDVEQANALTKTTLLSNFELDIETFENTTDEDSIILLKRRNYSPEKLDMLIKLVYEYAIPFNSSQHTIQILKKIVLMLDILEKEHHIQSFENIDKRNTINRFLSRHG